MIVMLCYARHFHITYRRAFGVFWGGGDQERQYYYANAQVLKFNVGNVTTLQCQTAIALEGGNMVLHERSRCPGVCEDVCI